MRKKRVTVAWVAICLSALFAFFGAVAVFASDKSEKYVMPTYAVSKQYASSEYCRRLIKTPLLGNQAVDVISVALSQVGYHEGNSDADLGGMNPGGNRDFVEYNVLVGRFDNGQGNGVSYGYSWCASFVNWCLRQARVPESTTGGDSFISCWQWLKACRNMGIYREKGAYVPQMGDIIFFKDYTDPTIEVAASHVGLVIASDGKSVCTVEGNTSAKRDFESRGDNVAIKTYPLDSKYIVGYGTPEYAGADITVGGWQDVNADKAELILSEEIPAKIAEGSLLRPVVDTEIYKVIFQNADGSVISESVGFYGNSITVPSVQAPDGFEFLGWGQKVPDKITENATYTAVIRDTRILGFVSDVWSNASGKAMIIAAASCLGIGAVVGLIGGVSASIRKRTRTSK